MYIYLMLPAAVRAEVPALAAAKRDRRERHSRHFRHAATVRTLPLEVIQ